MAKDYYEILGINRSATENEIKTAFRTLAHKYHPDKATGSDEKFKEINEAYQVLSNAEKRKQYDQFGQNSDTGGPGFQWQDMAGGSNPFGGFGNFSTAQDVNVGDLGDMLGSMFGFQTQSRSRANAPRRGQDIQITVPVTFEESYNGTTKDIDYQVTRACEQCQGSGNDPKAKVTTCATCHGTGHVTRTQSTFMGTVRMQVECTACDGSGKHVDKKCPECHGATVRAAHESFSVAIPAGIDEDTVIRLSNRGNGGVHQGPRGDLLVRVSIAAHTHFTRDEYDIRCREDVPLSTLITGGSASVRTVDGHGRLSIPAHTESGKTFILKGKGFEKLRGRGRGDMLVTVHARVPKKLNAKQRSLLESFEKSLDDGSGDGKKWWA
jgi:molecular chaperone DnaJ